MIESSVKILKIVQKIIIIQIFVKVVLLAMLLMKNSLSVLDQLPIANNTKSTPPISSVFLVMKVTTQIMTLVFRGSQKAVILIRAKQGVSSAFQGTIWIVLDSVRHMIYNRILFVVNFQRLKKIYVSSVCSRGQFFYCLIFVWKLLRKFHFVWNILMKLIVCNVIPKKPTEVELLVKKPPLKIVFSTLKILVSV